jgi:hypothetical protein
MPEFEWFRDTDPRALKVFLELLLKMPVPEKLRNTFDMMRLLRNVSAAGVRKMYPDADEREVFLRTAARCLDRETMIRVYDWDPQAHVQSWCRTQAAGRSPRPFAGALLPVRVRSCVGLWNYSRDSGC